MLNNTVAVYAMADKGNCQHHEYLTCFTPIIACMVDFSTPL